MSSPSPGMTAPPPQQQQAPQPGLTLGVSTAVASLALIPALFALVFHLGAAYLSYKKYGSIGWAILNFFFAVFYYPYYAFFLADTPAASAVPSVMTAGRRVMKALRK